MVGIHSLVDSNKVPNPKFLLLKEHCVNCLQGEIIDIVQAVQDLEFNMATGIVIIPTVLYIMFDNSTSVFLVPDVGLVIT